MIKQIKDDDFGVVIITSPIGVCFVNDQDFTLELKRADTRKNKSDRKRNRKQRWC